MCKLGQWLIVVVGLLFVGTFAQVHAEEKSLQALIPWKGEGQVFAIAPEKMLFLGAFEGIMYIETAEGKLDEGFVRCPTRQTLDLKTRDTSASGHCVIITSKEDTAFAKWSCSGKIGGCKGTFTLTGGTGGLKGISGASELFARTALGVLVKDKSSGDTVRAAIGLAILPELTYEIPPQ